ncbi:hypothetical protein GCK72_010791 [Caenorhabditis remanei]|uniref:Uncharacterized protein n=1 Tax=Caenorhabditis remanei TaxID=31234 RepID=A0A6A5H653_CAERE|nr:hypothetical protein GCK72_010791 [Caenorhabditis remanei]KAF1762529.1 hypothetical protein GCK72_010791 [Caenorhabditis remanei]
MSESSSLENNTQILLGDVIMEQNTKVRSTAHLQEIDDSWGIREVEFQVDNLIISRLDWAWGSVGACVDVVPGIGDWASLLESSNRMVLLKVSPCLNHHTRVVSGLVVMKHVLELIWLIVLEQIDDLFELSEVNGHVEFLISWFDWAWDSVVAGGKSSRMEWHLRIELVHCCIATSAFDGQFHLVGHSCPSWMGGRMRRQQWPRRRG